MSDFNFDFSLGAIIGASVGALTGYAQGGGFSPASLFSAGEQGAWYDPSDFSTMFQDSAGTTPVTAVGQPAGRINDKSGRGNHATQAASAARPVLQQDGAGKYYLAFDGVDDSLSAPTIDFSTTDKAFVCAGMRVVGTGTQGVVGFGVAGSRFDCIYLAGASPVIRGSLSGSVGPAQVTTPGVVADSANAVHTWLFDIAGAAVADEVKIRVNGGLPAQTVVTGPAGTGNLSSQTLEIGAWSGFLLSGRVYSIIVRAAASSSDQITAAETYVNSKTGAY